jgi:hypothetical protein
VQIVRENLKTS